MQNLEEIEEFERKYSAKGVKLADFVKLMYSGAEKPKYINGGSWDVYYTKDSDPYDSFWRLRLDPIKPQLTKKIKHKGNVQHRNEHDIELKPGAKSSSEPYIEAAISYDGYSKNFKIFKTYEIYEFSDVNFVYYLVFDEEMYEIGRFIEVEVNKNMVAGMNEKGIKPMHVLQAHSVLLEKLGISSRNVMKRSLFDIYRRK